MKPDPNVIFPIRGCKTITYVRPTVTNPNIIVGDFTYFSDTDFERHVLHHYDFNGDKLIIGKFCQIASGVTFIMNGANHQMNAASTYPFYIMEGWTQTPPAPEDLPLKGDTVIGNDVWIGQNATILPGVHIGDGAIIGLGSIVGHDIEPYTIVAGNPAKPIRKRFDNEMIALLLRLQWWNKKVGEIQQLIPLLTNSNFEYVKSALKKLFKQMDSSKIYPRTGDKQTVYLKSAITRPTIEVGDFTIYNDFVNDPRDFEKNNVLYHYPINHDRLIIGKFCSIACGAKFIYEAENRNDGVWIVFSLDNCIFAIRMYGNYGFETIAERDHDYLMIKYCDNEKYTGNNISGAIQELAVSTPFV